MVGKRSLTSPDANSNERKSYKLAKLDATPIAVNKDDSDEEELERYLFGRKPSSKSIIHEEDDDINEEMKQGFVLDTKGNMSESDDNDNNEKEELQPAWEDEDDEILQVDIAANPRLRKLRENDTEKTISGTEYSKRLQDKFRSLNRKATWASIDDNDEVDSDDEFLSSNAKLTVSNSRSGRINARQLDIVRVKDANYSVPSKSVVQSVQFHSSDPLLLTAGLDKTLRLFQIDGKVNSLVQSIYLKDLPIYNAQFSADGTRIISSGRRKYFYITDIQQGNVMKVPYLIGRQEKSLEHFIVSPDNELIAFSGDNGHIIITSSTSQTCLGTMKMNCSIRSMQFSPSGKELFSIGMDGQVYIWDVSKRRLLNKHTDDGCLHGTAIACNESYYATGSDSGIVNLYKPSSNGKPIKTFMNLTTPIDQLLFNPTGELLMMRSQRKKDALKIVHLESKTVFSNWPTQNTPLHYATCVDFSPSSQYMAIGNDRGRVLLYQLSHYT